MRIGSMFKATAERHPDKPALVTERAVLTFRDLDQRSDRLAAYFAARGLVAGDRIAVCLPNCAELVETYLGAAKAGVILVPLSSRLTAAEIEPILRQSKPQLCIMRGDCVISGLEPSAKFLIVGAGQATQVARYEDAIGSAEGHPADPALVPEDCLICYTSGTSGATKGVLLTHSNLIQSHAFASPLMCGFAASDIFLVSMPIVHRASMGRLIFMFCVGGTIVLLEKSDPEEIVSSIDTHRVTVASMVPTVAKLAIDRMEAGSAACSSLRRLLVMGGAFPDQIRTRLTKAIPGLQIHSMYASTEAGIITHLDPADQRGAPDGAGKAVPGMELIVADDTGSALPAGEVGEILLRSGEPGRHLVHKGYYDNPALTAQSFHGTWFKTGDMGRLGNDGMLFIVDRKSDMIKTGGLNVYSREVETCLAQHPAVAETAVVGVPDAIYDEAVVAFIQLKPGVSVPEPSEIAAFCKDRLAGYKKPKHVRFVSGFPRNELGKILKRTLREDFLRDG